MTTFLEKLALAQATNDSHLCVGLDPEPANFPDNWKDDPSRIYDFCAGIVDATKDQVEAFKPQIAYFAAHRAEHQLELLMEYMGRVAPNVLRILDFKRGDIGSTAEQYAREGFKRYQADAVTLSPFLGFDSIEPYLKYDGKGLFLLCRTSNKGGSDLQAKRLETGELLYEYIAQMSAEKWNAKGQLGLVVGATFPSELEQVRKLAPAMPLLIPGYGSQGGTAKDAMAGLTSDGPVVINSSRAVLYAARREGETFKDAARRAAIAARIELNAARSQV